MQLCALETHIEISRTLNKFVNLMRNHRSCPKPSPCPLQDEASGPKISGDLIVGCNGSACLLQDTSIGVQEYWQQLSANSTIVACRTAHRTSFLCCVAGSASCLSATAIVERFAIWSWIGCSTNYDQTIGWELSPVILQANHRVLQESRRAMASHNEISWHFWAACWGLKRAWRELLATTVISHEINKLIQSSWDLDERFQCAELHGETV